MNRKLTLDEIFQNYNLGAYEAGNIEYNLGFAMKNDRALKDWTQAEKLGYCYGYEAAEAGKEFRQIRELCQRLRAARDSNDWMVIKRLIDSLSHWGDHRMFDSYARGRLSLPNYVGHSDY